MLCNFHRLSDDTPATEETELLECLRKIGKGLIASGISVGVVENTLTEIALAYDMECEIVALPNVIMIKLGQSSQGRMDFAVQRLTTFSWTRYQNLWSWLTRSCISRSPWRKHPADRSHPGKKLRFNPALVIFGYFLSCVGLTMLFRPELHPC